MNRIIVMVLAMLMALCLTATVSEATPSKTTDDVNQVVNDDDDDSAPSFAVIIVDDTQQVKQELEKIKAFVTQGSAPVEYFPEDVRKEIAKKWPEGTDLTKLQLNEFITLESVHYKASIGDVRKSFKFATEYADGQQLVALVGIFNADGTVEWIVLDVIVEDGLVKILFTQESLEKISNNPSALAILSE